LAIELKYTSLEDCGSEGSEDENENEDEDDSRRGRGE